MARNRTNNNVSLWTTTILLLLSLTAGPNMVAADEDGAGKAPLEISQATWEGWRKRLQVSGQGAKPHDWVTITNVADGTALGRTLSDIRGRWNFEIRRISTVPCSVQAETRNRVGVKTVKSAPGNCAGGSTSSGSSSSGSSSSGSSSSGSSSSGSSSSGSSSSGSSSSGSSSSGSSSSGSSGSSGSSQNTSGKAALEITQAVWEQWRRRLQVSGKGVKPHEWVTLTNAADGASLGRILSDIRGRWSFDLRRISSVPCSVQAETRRRIGVKTVKNAPSDCAGSNTGNDDHSGGNDDTDDDNTGGGGTGGGGQTGSSTLRVLAANDLGMHCADQDYQIFSILPPFNVVHGQVVRQSTNSENPQLLSNSEVDLVYSSTSNPADPAGLNSINTTSRNASGVYKSNFWEQISSSNTLGDKVYAPLYPGQDKLGLCDPSVTSCPSALDLFAPLAEDTGLPVPDPAHLPNLVTAQQKMPAVANGGNQPQSFDRFDKDLPFFAALPFGTTVQNVNWWAADGIPILPVDDVGRLNAYPLMKIQAIVKGADPTVAANVLASTDIVLPVASEADCQNCHADPEDAGDGQATTFASVTNYADGTPWTVIRATDAPGPQNLLNAAKINILRLHDAKHGEAYTSSADGSSTPCRNGSEDSCLDVRRKIQCAQCHYTPALDLAQVGPVDELEQGVNGRQQTRHISMSRAMHGHHGQFTELFPQMPAADDPIRTPAKVQEVLNQTCYQCHPGKQTKCLRGAMANGGVVCQDCHGNMQQVGNDFSGGLPSQQGLDLAKRIPWANEPKCQSCHIGDAMTLAQADTSDFVMAKDGIRLAQAYRKSDAGKEVLPVIAAPDSRFAENESLYRLSKGHGGIMCEGCHGSTHAIWPVKPDGDNTNSPFLANDNMAAIGLQGHSGTITECSTCHVSGSLGRTLDGPHGMHPVNDPSWTSGHEDVAERNKNACRTCHGTNGEGTVLSRTAAERTLRRDEDGTRTIVLTKGTKVSCDLCHDNEL